MIKKELSIEDKAKHYDEAIERARQIHDADRVSGIELTTCEEIFPELAESEDERIRKALIFHYQGDGCMCTNEYRIDFKDIRAWLEKQGDKSQGKSALESIKEENIDNANKVEPKFKPGDWVFIEEVKEHKNGPFQIKTVDYFGYSFDEYHTIPFMYEDILSKWTITDAKDGDVLSYRDGQWIFIYKEKIDDSSFYYHTLYSTIHQDLTINDAGFTLLGDAIIPATKEQRSLLFAKMEEAGYEWDAEKKELKKIEEKHTPKHKVGDTIYYNSFGELKSMIVANVTTDNTDSPMYEDKNGNAVFEKDLVEHKPTLGEEDKERIKNILSVLDVQVCWDGATGKKENPYQKEIDWLKSLKNRVQPQPKQEWSEEDEEIVEALNDYVKNLDILFSEIKIGGKNIISKEFREKVQHWLKSIRPQNTWKPSDEQIEALDDFIYAKYPNIEKYGAAVKSLYQDLKKLRKE